MNGTRKVQSKAELKRLYYLRESGEITEEQFQGFVKDVDLRLLPEKVGGRKSVKVIS